MENEMIMPEDIMDDNPIDSDYEPYGEDSCEDDVCADCGENYDDCECEIYSEEDEMDSTPDNDL